MTNTSPYSYINKNNCSRSLDLPEAASCCAHGNENLGSTKCGGFLEYLRNWQLPKNASAVCSRSCLTFRPSKMRALGCDETSGSDCPVTRRHTPEERKSQTSIRSIKTVQTTSNLREGECVVLCGTVVLQRVAITAVLTETGVAVTNVYQRMRGTRLLWPFMSWFIFAIVVLIDGGYGPKISEFGANYFRERMGQVLYTVLLLSLIQYRVCIATEKV